MPLLEAVLEAESGLTGLNVKRLGGGKGWPPIVSSEGGRGACGSGGVALEAKPGSSLITASTEAVEVKGILAWHFFEVMCDE